MKVYSLVLIIINIKLVISERISVTKCREYKQLVGKNFTTFHGFSFQVNDTKFYRTRTMYDCNSFSGLIVGGEITKPGEFPHMAAIGWKNSDGSVYFKCGGSLIAKNFILSVAHCVKDNQPSFVRLGEQNLGTLDDKAEPIDVNIRSIIPHDDYNRDTKENDIALVKLDKDVTFNKRFIRPACLAQSNSFGTKVVATGWGKVSSHGRTSDELLKVTLNLVSTRNCNNIADLESDFVFPSQICAGGTRNKDTCQGDSGGPIQVSHADARCVYDIVGLTSYGAFKCGTSTPGIYTRVTSYLDWIESQVWPQNQPTNF